MSGYRNGRGGIRVASVPAIWQECVCPEPRSLAMRPVLIAHDEPADFRDLLSARFPGVEFVYATTAGDIVKSLARHDPEVAFSIKHPGFPSPGTRTDTRVPVGALDSGGRLGVRPSPPLGRRAGHGDQRRGRARPVSRRDRHRSDARSRRRIPELCRAATCAVVEAGGVHAASGPHAPDRRIRQDRKVRGTQREGAGHAGGGHPRDTGPASCG